jgi:hypothetical protein
VHAIEFLLEKLRSAKNNADHFESMKDLPISRSAKDGT